MSRLKWVQKFQLGRILSISFCVENTTFHPAPDHEETTLLVFDE
jgi:hypothetical protein